MGRPQQAYSQDPLLQQLISHCHQGELDPHKYQIRDGLLFYEGKLHLGTKGPNKNLFYNSIIVASCMDIQELKKHMQESNENSSSMVCATISRNS